MILTMLISRTATTTATSAACPAWTRNSATSSAGFRNITVPDSCTNECFRTFSAQEGIHATGALYRIDSNATMTDTLSVFARARYTSTDWNFNGVFAGSGTGNCGLASAVAYLTPTADSPIQEPAHPGQAAFPGTTQFGIRSVSTGR